MRNKMFPLALVCLLIAGFSSPVCAQQLNDASIQKLYANNIAALDDPEKTRTLMKAELADDFIEEVGISQEINGQQPKNSVETNDKDQTIDNMVDTIKTMQGTKRGYEVINTEYSEDHKFAYITRVSTYVGTMVKESPMGQINAGYIDDTRECVDKISLQGTDLKILTSTCKDKSIIKRLPPA